MSIPIQQQNDLTEYIEKNILYGISGMEKITSLIRLARLEKKLPGISTFENAEFHVNENGVSKSGNIEIDRLSLVDPPSFIYSFKLRITGHFLVKYKSSGISLPSQVDPFLVNYTGIIIQKKGDYELKNESFILIE